MDAIIEISSFVLYYKQQKKKKKKTVFVRWMPLLAFKCNKLQS